MQVFIIAVILIVFYVSSIRYHRTSDVCIHSFILSAHFLLALKCVRCGVCLCVVQRQPSSSIRWWWQAAHLLTYCQSINLIGRVAYIVPSKRCMAQVHLVHFIAKWVQRHYEFDIFERKMHIRCKRNRSHGYLRSNCWKCSFLNLFNLNYQKRAISLLLTPSSTYIQFEWSCLHSYWLFILIWAQTCSERHWTNKSDSWKWKNYLFIVNLLNLPEHTNICME